MQWEHYCAENQVVDIKTISTEKPVLIFKHSTRCPVSSMAKRELFSPSEDFPDNAHYVFIDIINCRALSKAVEAEFNVVHESPQVLVIVDEKCVYQASHQDISSRKLLPELIN
ncbi:MAG: bacillithiol system redox-active protein YtxJ [Cyclobacteriaceae bacterium]